jgi:putative copper export protein
MLMVRFLHLLSAAVWVGGLITLAVLVAAARRTTSGDRSLLQVLARAFSRLSWPAMAILVVTGLIQASTRGWSGLLPLKVSLVVITVILAAWHQVGARRQAPALRAGIEGIILLLSVVILALATAL